MPRSIALGRAVDASGQPYLIPRAGRNGRASSHTVKTLEPIQTQMVTPDEKTRPGGRIFPTAEKAVK